jgi:DNA damage-binding protein 1
VFATCEHPSLIYGSEGRIIYSAVTAEKATSVCSFDSESYPGAIAIATSEDLRIALVDAERTTHVQTLLVNETVRRIAYSPSLKAFGMGTIKRILKGGVEIMQSHFKLADEILFKELDTYPLNEDELVESVMRCELDDGTGSLAERFVVGTAYLEDEPAAAERGRIIILEVTEDRMLKLVTELSLKGGCRCLAMVEGKIVAALIKTVSSAFLTTKLNTHVTITLGRHIFLRILNSQPSKPHQMCQLPHIHSAYRRHCQRRHHCCRRSYEECIRSTV